MKILITGSSGYIGSNFINLYKSRYRFQKFSLLAQNIEDICFDDIETVLHFAALVHQKVEFEYERYHEVNVEYPLKLAKLAKENGVKQFVFMSSVSVYGEIVERVDEKSTCRAVTAYAKSKLQAERELLELSDDDFKVSIIRAPMVYGKDAPGNIDTLVKLVKNVRVIPLGGIQNQRSFLYVENLCYLLHVVIRHEHSGLFLISDNEPISTTKLITLIAKNLDKQIYLIKIPLFENLLKLLKPSFHKRLYGSLEVDNSQSINKLFGEIKTSLPFSVEEGIALMIRGERL